MARFVLLLLQFGHILRGVIIDVNSNKLACFKTVCRLSENDIKWAHIWIDNFTKRYQAWNSNREHCITAFVC